jgi:hypothetical protein
VSRRKLACQFALQKGGAFLHIQGFGDSKPFCGRFKPKAWANAQSKPLFLPRCTLSFLLDFQSGEKFLIPFPLVQMYLF